MAAIRRIGQPDLISVGRRVQRYLRSKLTNCQLRLTAWDPSFRNERTILRRTVIGQSKATESLSGDAPRDSLIERRSGNMDSLLCV
jgi:hypothetical protein